MTLRRSPRGYQSWDSLPSPPPTLPPTPITKEQGQNQGPGREGWRSEFSQKRAGHGLTQDYKSWEVDMAASSNPSSL